MTKTLARITDGLQAILWARQDARMEAGGWTIERRGFLGLGRQYRHPRAVVALRGRHGISSV